MVSNALRIETRTNSTLNHPKFRSPDSINHHRVLPSHLILSSEVRKRGRSLKNRHLVKAVYDFKKKDKFPPLNARLLHIILDIAYHPTPVHILGMYALTHVSLFQSMNSGSHASLPQEGSNR